MRYLFIPTIWIAVFIWTFSITEANEAVIFFMDDFEEF